MAQQRKQREADHLAWMAKRQKKLNRRVKAAAMPWVVQWDVDPYQAEGVSGERGRMTLAPRYAGASVPSLKWQRRIWKYSGQRPGEFATPY